jgi:hypothetical protein
LYEHGIDAAVRYKDNCFVILFKGVHIVLLNYASKSREGTNKISIVLRE